MTFLVERLAELRRHIEHLRAIRSRVRDGRQLAADLSLQNDVLFSLLVVCQSVIDIAGELAARRGIRFQDFTGAIRALGQVDGFPADLIDQLLPLPGFRNIVVHEYVELDYQRVIQALDGLEPVEAFIAAVSRLELKS